MDLSELPADAGNNDESRESEPKQYIYWLLNRNNELKDAKTLHTNVGKF